MFKALVLMIISKAIMQYQYTAPNQHHTVGDTL
jgi:hypothetical protein